jgi:alkyl hydroperoxide reductase subunit AhpC
VEALGIPFPILSNPHADVPVSYGVFDHFGDGLATGSVFLVDREGQIRWSYIYAHTYDVVTGGTVLEQLRQIASA